eukprot:1589082-Rhodomonas_salina.1
MRGSDLAYAVSFQAMRELKPDVFYSTFRGAVLDNVPVAKGASVRSLQRFVEVGRPMVLCCCYEMSSTEATRCAMCLLRDVRSGERAPSFSRRSACVYAGCAAIYAGVATIFTGSASIYGGSAVIPGNNAAMPAGFAHNYGAIAAIYGSSADTVDGNGCRAWHTWRGIGGGQRA